MQPLPKLLCGLVAALTLASTSQGQSPAVQQLYAQAHAAQEAGNSEKAVSLYRELLHTDPSIAAAYNNLGRLYFNLNRFSEAADVLQRGLALNPDMAPAQVMLGASYLKLNAPEKALPALRQGVAAMPDDRFARQTLAQALLRTKHPDEAAEQLRRLLALDPKDQRSWYLLGKVELQLSQEAFARMRALDVNSPLSHQLSGEIMESLQNTPGAVAEYKQALALDPNDADVQYRLADLYWSTGDFAAAEPALSRYLAARPADCNAQWRLANTLAKRGADSADVLAHASAAVQACPELPEPLAERARALLQQNKAAEALTDLKAAEKISPDEPSVQFLLAKAFRSLGNPTAATAAMARFTALDKAEHDAKEKHAAEVLAANP